MTRNFRSFAASAGLAISLAFSAPVSANTITLGTLSEGDPVPVLGTIGTAANTDDRIEFSLASLEDLGTALAAVPPIKIRMLEYGLSSVSAALYAGNGTLIGDLVGGTSETFTNLAAGDYYIAVTGTAFNPNLGGTYALTLLADAAAPVPGPAAILPALAGAGAIAWRRRRSRGKKREVKLVTA